MKTQFLTFFIISILALSCKKETSEEENFEGGITLTNPTSNDTITGTQTIVTGSISGNLTLHGYHMVLYRVSDNAVLAEKEVDNHSTSITLNDTLTYSVSQLTQVKLHVESAYNHEGDMTTKDVIFNLQP